MIQVSRLSQAGSTNIMYVNLFDSYLYPTDSPFFFTPLVKITSQETNKSMTFIPTALDVTYKQRYFKMTFVTSYSTGTHAPAVGLIYVGYKDFPYGLYDMEIYKNTSSSNLDATGLQLSYMGLMNLYSATTANQAVDYTEYESTQEQQVYLTNTYV